MTDYRRQQLAAAALIDSGNYTAEQVAEVYGWIRGEPEPIEQPKQKRKRKSKLLRILCRLLK